MRAPLLCHSGRYNSAAPRALRTGCFFFPNPDIYPYVKNILPARPLRLAAACFCSLFQEKECVACGKRSRFAPLCADCEGSLLDMARNPPGKACAICGAVLLSEEGVCTECRARRVILSADKVTAVFPYRAWPRDALLDWKMRDERRLSRTFSEAADIAISRFYGKSVPLVAIPPRISKIRSRGWDQIAELTSVLRRDYGYKTLPLLERLSDTEQKSRSAEERLSLARESYTGSRLLARLARRGELPEKVLLIDDVLTTGATAESCARVLKDAGIKRVDALALFRA